MFTVALIGPDGCGKTTVARHLEQTLPWRAKYVYMGVSLESSNLMLPTSRLKLALKRILGRPPDTAGPRDSRKTEENPTGTVRRATRNVKRTFRLLNQIAEESFRQLVVRWHRMRGRVVLLDRDFYADYYSYDIAGANRNVFRKIHGFLLRHCYRKPDLVIFLDVSGATMFARKGEGSIELLEQRRQEYRGLRDVLRSFEIVDGEQPLEDALESVKGIVSRFGHRGSARSKRVRCPALCGEGPIPYAVVLGMDCVTGLQTARILARRGVPVIGVAANPRHYCCRTRVCQTIVVADTKGEELIDTLVAIGPALPEPAVLFPCSDLSVLNVSRHRQRLDPWYRFSLPDHDTVELLADKVRFAQFAQREQLPVPKTRILECRQDADQAVRELSFPCFLKPGVKTARWESSTNKKVFVVSNAEQFLETYQQCAAWTDVLLVQESILGDVADQVTSNVYIGGDGQVSASFVSQKIRQWPLDTGTACLSAASDNQHVLSQTVSLFDRVVFRGLGYLEMKRDSRSGEYLIVETNIGRPTGRSAAADASGVELLLTAYCDLTGRELPVRQQANTTGKKWIHIRRDLQASATQWWRGELSCLRWLQSLRGPKTFAVFSWSDPAPIVAELIRALARAFGKSRQ